MLTIRQNMIMRYKSVLLPLFAVLVWALGACAPEPIYSSHPEYYGKTLYFTDADPKSLTVNTQNDVNRISTCNAGDSVTVFLPVIKSGEHIYNTTYKWTLARRSGSETVAAKDIDDDKDPCSKNVPPMWTFPAPTEPGEYVVYFRAVYSYSAMAPDGSGTIKGGFPTLSGGHGYEDTNGGKSSVYGVLRVN